VNSPTTKDDGSSTAVTDESGRWYTPSDHEEDNAPPDIKAERLRSLRLFRKYTIAYYDKFDVPLALVMYLTYFAFAILIVVAEIVNTSNKGQDDYKPFYITTDVIYWLWIAMNIVISSSIWVGRRQSIAWTGLYTTLSYGVFIAGTLASFTFSFTISDFPIEYVVLILMACTVFILERIIEPRDRQLYCAYKGVISRDQIGKQPPISGVGRNALSKLIINASKAMDISEETLETIKQQVNGLKIRQDEGEALDDWMVIIYKLSKAVSIWPPLPLCRPKYTLSPAEYRNLVRQLIIYIRVYMDTGKVENNEAHLNRSAPLTFVEALTVMTKLSWQVPGWFLLATIPRTLQSLIQTFALPIVTLRFTNSVIAGDQTVAVQTLIAMTGFFFVNPCLLFLANVFESAYSSRMIAKCRSKMVVRLVKGGTEYHEKNRPGSIIDGFSNHLTQVVQYSQFCYIQMFGNLAGIIGSLATMGTIDYMFPIYIFVSIVPILVSVDYFDGMARNTGAEKAQTDAKVMGKISSAVDCSDAIRASNAGEWVVNDMKSLLEQLRLLQRSLFFRSDLAQNFMQFMSLGVFTVLTTLPIGFEVAQGRSFGDFTAIAGMLSGLISPIMILGAIQSQTLIYSASLQTVQQFMDSSLDEESPSEKSSPEAELMPLSGSIKVKDVKFRYQAKSPDVLKGIGMDIGQGTYNVICGESGSGKSTVLNLLMRFYKPTEGTIEWNGNNIYKTTLASFRKQVGVMFQRTMIYQASIRDNISFGLEEKVPGEVEKAAQDAEIADVINRLPDGYDTVIGGDALVGLSGGQLQRICMARALYRKPSVLLLDEATSALDKETSRSIIGTLVNIRDKEGLTLVSVSHQTDTAMEANKIIVLAEGVVAEEGTYDELVSRDGGIFRRIVNAGEE